MGEENNYKLAKLGVLINNQCSYVSTAGKNPGTRCKKLTGLNKYFCPEHFKAVSRKGVI